MARPRDPDPTLPLNRLERERELSRRRMARQSGRNFEPRLEMVWCRFLALPTVQRAEFIARLAKLQSS
jgi:hypothetical protein